MRLRPEEIQVGDVFEARDGSHPWKVIDARLSELRIHYEPNDNRMWVSRYVCSTYNFVHSVKYSNLLPYHERS